MAAACAATVVLFQGAGAQPAPVVAIRNARIITVSGPEIASGTILLVDGKIKALGAAVAIPSGAVVIDGAGKVVMPGLVDANARFGLRATANELSSEITPQMHVLQQLNPRSPEVRRALQSGVTTACITPGAESVIGGLCGVVKTSGESLQQVTLRDGIAVQSALGEDTFNRNGAFLRAGAAGLDSIYLRRPNTRMGAVFELRHALDLADKNAVLARVRSGALPLRVHARVANDIRAAVTIADEFKVPHLIIDDCIEGYRDIDLLVARKVSVILGPFADPQSLAPERSAASLNNAGLLSAAGVPVAFGTNGGDETQLLLSAILAQRGGMNADLAVKAITQTAAEICGVADRVGSLQVGKDADILVLDGDPLEVTTNIEKVLINGQVVYRAE